MDHATAVDEGEGLGELAAPVEALGEGGGNLVGVEVGLEGAVAGVGEEEAGGLLWAEVSGRGC